MFRKDHSKSEDDDERYAGDEGGADGGEEGGGLPGGRIPNPPPRDAWVSRVVDDPANPPAAVVLAGWVGDATEEGRSRIYTDPSLASYVEVQDEDVLHHESLDGDVPEGGSMVWVRSDAMVTPGGSGTGSGAAAGGDFFTGPVLEQNRRVGAGAARDAGPVQITLLTIAGCHTHQLGCSMLGCATQNALCTAHPIICSQVCQQGGGRGPGGVGHDPFDPVHPSLDCPSSPVHCDLPRKPGDLGYPVGYGGQGGAPQAAMAMGGNIGQTGWQGCGQGGGGNIGQTGWQGCGEGGGGNIGQTGWQGCGQPQISLPGCIQTGTCGGGREGTDTVQAAAFGQPSIGCIHLPNSEVRDFGAAAGNIGQTGWLGCGQQGGGDAQAAPQALGAAAPQPGPTAWPGCGPVGPSAYPGCGPIGQSAYPGCGPIGQSAYPGCGPIGQSAYPGCGPVGPSAYPGCGPIGQSAYPGCGPVGPSAYPGCGPVGPSAYPGCGLIGATAYPGCLSTRSCPSAVDACPTRLCGGGGGEQANPQRLGAAQPGQFQTYAAGCPTLGYTCTIIQCPQRGGGGGGGGGGFTAAAVCTQIGCAPQGGGGAGGGRAGAGVSTQAGCGNHTLFGCPRTRTCPPTYQPGCGPHAELGGSTAVTLCTLAPWCPPTIHCPPGAGEPQHTAATICTQIGC